MTWSGSVPAQLIALFLSDTEAHAALIGRGVASIADDGSRQKALLPELLLAAHSIRGAAKIVGFEPAVQLAEAVELALQEAEGAGASLHPRLTAPLFAAVTAFEEMVTSGASGLHAWADSNRERVVHSIHDLTPGGFESARRAAIDVPRVSASRTAPQPPLAPTEANILELFRTETATCTETLSQGLVELESGGKADLEKLMRAAHSIKGAARIVGVDVAVQMAHALEDCLVKAQDGLIALQREAIDLLLASVDVLAELSQAAGPNFEQWQRQRGPGAAEILRQLRQLAQLGLSMPLAPSGSALGLPRADSIEEHGGVAGSGGQIQLKAPESLSSAAQRDRVVRVNAQSINRLMGLAGESLVESRRVQTFSVAMQRLKRRHAELSTLLENLDRRLEPLLDTSTRAGLNEAKARALDCRALLSEHVSELDGYARRVDDLSDRLYREALKSRMRPFGDCAHGFPRMVRDVGRRLGKDVRFELSGEATDVDRDVLEGLEAPLTHLLRNAVDHGLETPAERSERGKPSQGVVRVEARHHAGMLAITVSDDGRGIDSGLIRSKIVQRGLLAEPVVQALSPVEVYEFIFLPGFSTAASVTEISGRGVGLDAVRSAVEAASGVVRVSSELGRGTSFHLQLPVTRSVMRAVVAEVAGEAYAFPLLRIDRILRVPAGEVKTLGAVQYFVLEGVNVSLVSTQQVLGFGSEQAATGEVCVVVIGDRARRYALAVDRFLGEHDLVVRPLDARLGKVQDIAAAAILVDGAPALILDVDDLMRSIEKLAQAGRIEKLTARSDGVAGRPRKRVLVVDDSITVREVERQLLVNRGYDVDVAVDGIDGLNSVRSTRYDLVVSDIDMPRLSGLELVRTIKQDPKFGAMPIIIVSYKDREEDRMRGLDAGASCYLTKSSFHDETLVRAVEDLIGSADA